MQQDLFFRLMQFQKEIKESPTNERMLLSSALELDLMINSELRAVDFKRQIIEIRERKKIRIKKNEATIY